MGWERHSGFLGFQSNSAAIQTTSLRRQISCGFVSVDVGLG